MEVIKGRFKKGVSGNPSGKPKGAVCRVTLDIREALKFFIDNNIEDLQEQYNKLDAKDKLALFEKLLQYVIPRKREEEVHIEDEQTRLIKRAFSNNN